MVKILFEEKQNFRIFIAISTVILVLFSAACIVQIGFHHQLGNHPASNSLLIGFFICSVAANIFSYLQHLKLIITESAISVSFGILASTITIPITDIKNIRLRKYDAVREFMGWGVRYNNEQCCYTVSGNEALEIELKSSKQKILVGTRRTGEIQHIIDTFLSSD